MMTNILKLNKLEKQQIYPKTKEYDLGEQLCECLLKFENVWEEKNIEIETEIAEDVKVSTDGELLSLVWNNLFSNAFKFTPEGGKVTLVLESTEHHAIVKVRDTGCGMSPEVGAHIFEKFYQGDTSHAMQGNGLGLAWRKVGKKLLFPPVWIIVLLTVICTVALVAIFINGWEMSPLAYISYVLAFYTLTAICIVCWKVLPGYYKSVKSKMHENQYIDRYMTDAVFKSNVGLYRSLAINLIYVVVNAVL